MHVRFSDVDDQFIKNQVKEGYYTNETELVRDAVRRMREENERKSRLQMAIEQGIESMERGELIPWSPALMDAIKQEGFRKSRNKEPYHSDKAIP